MYFIIEFKGPTTVARNLIPRTLQRFADLDDSGMTSLHEQEQIP